MLFFDKIKAYNVILASKSPRRQELLKNLDISFTIADIVDVDETFPDNIVAGEIPVYLSKLKSKVYLKNLNNKDILITADTIVWLENKALNKPKDRIEALEMVKTLSGKTHKVYTGVTLTSKEKTKSFVSETYVYFKNISDDEAVYYVDKYKPYDKAGAYGIQEWIGYIGITKIEGSYFNVMGLPVQQLYAELNEFVK